MPRTPQEQTEQATRYAEILEAQQTAYEKRMRLVHALAPAAAFSLTVAALLMAFFSTDGVVRLGVAVAVALLSTLLTPVLTVAFATYFQIRRRRTSERLSSLQREDEAATSTPNLESHIRPTQLEKSG